MYHDRDRSTFDDAAPITIPTTSNVVPLRPEPQQPADTKRPRKAPKSKARKYRLKELVERHPDLNASAKLIGAKTCELFDGKEECAFASNDWYFRTLGVSASTVRRAFVALEKADLMHREINAGSHGQNKVRPNWSMLAAQSEPASDTITDDHHSQSHATAGGDQSRLPEACRDDRGGQSTVTAIRQAQPKPENQAEIEGEKGAPTGAVSLSDMDAWFNVFWTWYPHKVARPVAMKAFTSIAGMDVTLYEKIMDGLMVYCDHLKASGDYPAAPATWLQQERWNDKPAKFKPKVQARGNRPAI